jgi:hypothetical protein
LLAEYNLFIDENSHCCTELNYTHWQKDARVWMDTVANSRLHATTRERPMDRLDRERPLLQPLPSKEFDVSRVITTSVSKQGFVRFDTNRYSAPHSLAGSMVSLHVGPHTITLFDLQGRQVAHHTRSWEKHRPIENPAHIKGILAERKKARHTKRVETFLAFAPECAPYLKGLLDAELHVPTQIDKIFDLVFRYGKSDVMTALIHALPFGAFGAHYLERIIHQRRAAANAPEPQPISLSKKPELSLITIDDADLSIYDRLFESPEAPL